MINLNKKLSKIEEQTFFFSCYNCKNLPKIILNDENYVLFSCSNCRLIEKESIDNINSNNSKFLEKGKVDICKSIEILDFKKVLADIMIKEIDKFILVSKFLFHFNRFKMNNTNRLSLKLIDNIKSKMFNIIINSLTTKLNLLLLNYILDFTYKYNLKASIKVNFNITELKISSEINNLITEDSKKFIATINIEKEKIFTFSDNLNEKEINFLNEYIRYIFSPINKSISDLDRKRKFFENAIRFSILLKRYILINQIKYENKNFIDINKTVNDIQNLSGKNSKNNGIFILSLIGKMLEKNNNKVYITKKKDEQFNDIELASFQTFLCLENYSKHELHFDFGEEENEKILKSSEEKLKFLGNLKKRISDCLKIDINRLICTNVHQGCVICDLIIMDEKEEEKKLLEENLINLGIIENKKKKIFDIIILNEDILDSKYDRNTGWGENEKRGGEKYIPPLKWNGFGINVKNKYDNGNNIWLDYHNKKGEYSIAYLGISNLKNEIENIVYFNKDSKKIKNIFNDNLLENENDLRKNNSKCGKGVYVFQDPNFAGERAGYLTIQGFKIIIMFMIRVNPENIRQPENFKKYWILDATPQDVRPYRILFQKIKNSHNTISLSQQILTSPTINIQFLDEIYKSKDEHLKKMREKYDKDLNCKEMDDEIFAIKLYTSNYFKAINNFLRNNEVSKEFNLKKDDIISWIKWLQKALIEYKINNDKIFTPKFERVYRGITGHRFPNNYGVGSCFFNKEFWSTSICRNFAFDWIKKEGTLLEIIIANNGNNEYKKYCQYIEDITYSKEQYEVLIAIYCHFRVINIIRKRDIDYVSLRCEGIFYN